MNFKTVNSWLKVRQALCELSRCIKEGGGSIDGLVFRLHPDDDYLQYSIDNGSTWNSNFPVGGNIVPTPHNTLTLGTESNSFNKVYTENVAYNGALRFSASSGYYFSQNTAFNWNQVIGGFFNPGNQFFVQAPGSVPANRGERFQNYGTSYLGGNVNLAGDIIPTTNLSRSIGSNVLCFNSIYSSTLRSNAYLRFTANNAEGIEFFNGVSVLSSEYVGGFHPTTRNFFLQSSGTRQPDLGHRFQLFGNQYVQGYTDVSVTTATPSGTYSVPISPVVKLTLTSNPTLNFANHTTGLSTTVKLILIQDATGGRTITWGNVKFPGAIPPTLSSNANAIDIIKFIWDGTQWLFDGIMFDLR